MPHDTPLIATIVAGLALAFVFGAVAQRLRSSPIVGYLLAGLAVGPHTPGFVADQALSQELAEIGVILLMFGVGLHFSPKDLMSVKAIAVPGALAQIALATLLGMGLGAALGWPLGSGLIFGLALSVASTVVLLRALQERRIVSSKEGRIAVGWLIVEDLVMVMALVLLPAIAPALRGASDLSVAGGVSDLGDVALAISMTLAKVAAFFVMMLVVGRRVIPRVLHWIAHTGSRELFRLGVLAIALGVAFGSAKLFGVSFALGAFFAGMILSESELSQQAAAETLPLRDAFAVLFFVSVGMLFNPMKLFEDAGPILATLATIVIGKSVAAFAIVRAFGHPNRTALIISASLAQIGEFSFILAGLGVSLQILSERGQDLILAGAILSILLNPLVFLAVDRLGGWLDQPQSAPPPPAHAPAEAPAVASDVAGHAIVIGFGRVGTRIGAALEGQKTPFLVIDEREEAIAPLAGRGINGLAGRALELLAQARVGAARALFVAIPDSFEAGQIIEQARRANAGLLIVARSHSDAEEAHLRASGADIVINGEQEIAEAMVARFCDPPNAGATARTA